MGIKALRHEGMKALWQDGVTVCTDGTIQGEGKLRRSFGQSAEATTVA